MNPAAKSILRNLLIYGILGGLLYFALRNAPLDKIWASLQQLKFWQILLLISLNVFIYLLTSARWWYIVQAENKQVKYFPLVSVRLAVFGVSYFTLGPQVGGEPLQVLYLQRKYGITYTRATATVIMDKLLEFLANFVMLAFGLTALLQAGILSMNGGSSTLSLIGLILLLFWPPIHIILLFYRIYPLSRLMQILPLKKFRRFISASEKMAGIFCRKHLSALLFATCVSLLASIAMLSEYFLITTFLKIDLSFWQTIAAWTSGWLSFLVPLPGGLGALEASQVFALGLFDVAAASALGVTLLIRGRDLLIGGLGLLLAGSNLHRNAK